MADSNAELAGAATRALLPIEAVRVAYLFGSRAGATARPDSDLDIGVIYADDAEAEQREILRRQVVAALTDALGAVGERADVVDLELAPSEIAFAAIRATRLAGRCSAPLRSASRRRWGEPMVDRDVVARRILALNETIANLRASDAGDEAQLRSQVLLRAATERWMQVAIESCIDLAFHVLASRGLPAPPSGRAAFQTLAMEGVLEATLAERLSNAVSMRNVLVHA